MVQVVRSQGIKWNEPPGNVRLEEINPKDITRWVCSYEIFEYCGIRCEAFGGGDCRIFSEFGIQNVLSVSGI